MPKKPAAVGIVVWCGTDVRGWVFSLQLYAHDNSKIPGAEEYNLPTAICLSILQCKESGQSLLNRDHIVVADNYYGNVPLIRFLFLQRTYMVAMLRSHTPYVPSKLSDRSYPFYADGPRGTMCVRWTEEATFILWKDLKDVSLVHTIPELEHFTMATVRRVKTDNRPKSKPNQWRKLFKIPSAINFYNQHMFVSFQTAKVSQIYFGFNSRELICWMRMQRELEGKVATGSGITSFSNT